MIRAVIAICAGLLYATGADANPKANQLFGSKSSASTQAPKVYGIYAKGCLAGGERLPESGPTWQAMRLSRNRNWGHPEAISFIKRLSSKAAKMPGWKGLYIGDISQPRGGPMTSGHQSHQVGLDIDIWMLPPKRLNLSRSERENISSISVRSKDQRSVTRNWTPQHMELLKTAALDPAVDRIFVTAPAKIAMCNAAKGNKKWLQKIRPLYGHHYHFHVRLKCPKGSPNCRKQTPTVKELSKNATGCDATLNWWVTDYLNPPKVAAKPKKSKPKPKKRGARDFVMADLPKQCAQVLASR